MVWLCCHSLSLSLGVNVFTNFDAHNDWRNHRLVAEAVHKYGGHYQAALSFAVYHEGELRACASLSVMCADVHT